MQYQEMLEMPVLKVHCWAQPNRSYVSTIKVSHMGTTFQQLELLPARGFR